MSEAQQALQIGAGLTGVVMLALDHVAQQPVLPGQLGQCAAELKLAAFALIVAYLFFEQGENLGVQGVLSVYAEEVVRRQSAHAQLRPGQFQTGLLDEFFDLQAVILSLQPFPCGAAVVPHHFAGHRIQTEHGLPAIGRKSLQQLLCTAQFAGADIDMVAEHQQKRLLAYPLSGAIDGMAEALLALLADIADPPAIGYQQLLFRPGLLV